MRLQLARLALLDDLHDAVVDGSLHAVLLAEGANDAVDGVHLAGLAVFQILEHGRLDIAVLLHGNGDQEGGKSTLECALVIEEFRDVLALHGSECRACGVTYFNALFHATDGNFGSGFVLGNVAKYAADYGAESREGGVDQQLRPACADEVFFLMDWTHQLQQVFHLFHLRVGDALHLAHVEGEAVRLAGEGAFTGSGECRAPFDDTSHGVRRAHDLGDARLGESVLEGYDDAVVGEIVLQHGDHLGVVELLGHQQDHVVFAAHLIGGEGFDGDGQLDCSGDMRALFVEDGDVGFVAVDQLYGGAVFRHISAQHGAERACTVDRATGIVHKIHPFGRFC